MGDLKLVEKQQVLKIEDLELPREAEEKVIEAGAEVEKVQVDDKDTERKVKIESGIGFQLRQKSVDFLRRFRNAFTWSPLICQEYQGKLLSTSW